MSGFMRGGADQLRAAIAAISGAALMGASNGGTAMTVQQGLDVLYYGIANICSAKYAGGAQGGGVDDTAAIQAALDSGAKVVFVPAGTFLCSGLVMPTTNYHVFHGEGVASILDHKAGGAKMVTWPTDAIRYTEGHIRDLQFKGTNGANHIIDTTGVGGLTMSNIFIHDVPTGYSGIYVNGLGATYVHDIRINGLEVYSNTAGHSGVRFGPLTSDSSVSDFIMNGGFAVNYCAYYDAGSATVRMSDSHPYNAAVNVVYIAGNGSQQQLSFDNVTFDNATNDLVYATNTNYINFDDCWFEAIKSGYSGLKLVGASGVSMDNTRFTGSVGAAAAVTADAASTDVHITGGNIGTAANYVSVFALAGARSYARGLAGYNPLGMPLAMIGSTSTGQAQNTTQYLGVNGGQSANTKTAFVMPENGTLTTAYVATTSAPAAGQTFTFNVQKNGATIDTLTITAGNFSASKTINASITQYDQIVIQSVFSATSGSADIRYVVRFEC